MTEVKIETLLAECAADVLETMFFLEPAEEGYEPEVPEDCVAVRIPFDGRPPGVFRLAVALEGARLAAANFSGDDGPVPDQRAVEAVAEMANMVCGAVLSRLESASSFALSSPEPETDSAEDWPGARAVVEFEEAGTLALALELDA